MIVLDASVVIALLRARDAFHLQSESFFNAHIEDEFALHAVTRAEVLVGPAREGRGAEAVRRLDALQIRTVSLHEDDTRALAQLRVRTGLKLPDACVLLAAMETHASMATFDQRLGRAAADLGIRALP